MGSQVLNWSRMIATNLGNWLPGAHSEQGSRLNAFRRSAMHLIPNQHRARRAIEATHNPSLFNYEARCFGSKGPSWVV